MALVAVIREHPYGLDDAVDQLAPLGVGEGVLALIVQDDRDGALVAGEAVALGDGEIEVGELGVQVIAEPGEARLVARDVAWACRASP